jgi:hypothetical protein
MNCATSPVEGTRVILSEAPPAVSVVVLCRVSLPTVVASDDGVGAVLVYGSRSALPAQAGPVESGPSRSFRSGGLTLNPREHELFGPGSKSNEAAAAKS